jgi:DNA-binding transcriptional regulator PaaX
MAKVKFSKRDNVVKALRSRHGASVFKLCALTDWKEHTVRAELSRLRKAGYGLERLHTNRVGIAATYRITAEPTLKSAQQKSRP